MKQIALCAIRSYQQVKFLFFVEKSCRFTPRCSEYTYQAIKRYGIIYGLYLGVKRIIRCHPWNPGGRDPVPTRGAPSTKF